MSGDDKVSEQQRLVFSQPGSGSLLERSWKLEVLTGADAGKTVSLKASPSLLGAAPAAALVLTDDTVSRYHLEIDLFADGLRLRDLDSTNGTFVGEERVREAFVEAGATFALGRTEVRAIAVDSAVLFASKPEPVLRLRDALAASTTMKRLFSAFEVLADTPSSVLLVGEPGSGRAECARLLHELGHRREHPFIRYRFEPGLSREAADAICFGLAEAGAKSRGGLFQRADRGTLLCEGVENLPLETQERMRETLETGELRPEGTKERRRVSVRVVTSLRKDLAKRSGIEPRLLRRLSVVRLEIPALEQRREDIIPLAQHFVFESGSRVSIGPELSNLLLTHSWTGNIDELRDAIRWTLFPEGVGEPFWETLREVFVFETVELLGGDVSRASKNLDVTALELWRYLGRREFGFESL